MQRQWKGNILLPASGDNILQPGIRDNILQPGIKDNILQPGSGIIILCTGPFSVFQNFQPLLVYTLLQIIPSRMRLDMLYLYVQESEAAWVH